MGAGASAASGAAAPSIEDVGKWSKEEVGEHVAAIGPAFEPYKDIVMNEAIDGEALLDVDDEDLEAYGVAKPHRKRILKKLGGLKPAAAAATAAPGPAADTAAADSAPAREQPSAAPGADSQANDQVQLFMSYPRGEQTSPFAHKLKGFFRERGFAVWMDEEGIQGGADFMSAIGRAIKASQGIIAIIDDKFCRSTYCNDELAMASSLLQYVEPQNFSSIMATMPRLALMAPPMALMKSAPPWMPSTSIHTSKPSFSRKILSSCAKGVVSSPRG